MNERFSAYEDFRAMMINAAEAGTKQREQRAAMRIAPAHEAPSRDPYFGCHCVGGFKKPTAEDIGSHKLMRIAPAGEELSNDPSFDGPK